MQRKDEIKSQDSSIKEAIRMYNLAHPDSPVTFVHGSSSAIFAYMGRRVTLPNGDEKVIPYAIIPTGTLRIDFGVHPISGELNLGTFGVTGSRKSAINYAAISGYSAEDADRTLKYAHDYSTRKFDTEVIEQNIEKLISRMDQTNYVRSLKEIVMQATNLMLLNTNISNKEYRYIDMLNDKLAKLKSELPDENLDKRFAKYTSRLKSILAGNLPFQSDEKFIADIKNQFPIVICSSVIPEDFNNGQPGEKVIFGEINTQTISTIFTPHEHVLALKSILAQRGIENVEVLGYDAKIKSEAKHTPLTSPLSSTSIFSQSATLSHNFKLADEKEVKLYLKDNQLVIEFNNEAYRDKFMEILWPDKSLSVDSTNPKPTISLQGILQNDIEYHRFMLRFDDNQHLLKFVELLNLDSTKHRIGFNDRMPLLKFNGGNILSAKNYIRTTLSEQLISELQSKQAHRI